MQQQIDFNLIFQNENNYNQDYYEQPNNQWSSQFGEVQNAFQTTEQQNKWDDWNTTNSGWDFQPFEPQQYTFEQQQPKQTDQQQQIDQTDQNSNIQVQPLNQAEQKQITAQNQPEPQAVSLDEKLKTLNQNQVVIPSRAKVQKPKMTRSKDHVKQSFDTEVEQVQNIAELDLFLKQAEKNESKKQKVVSTPKIEDVEHYLKTEKPKVVDQFSIDWKKEDETIQKEKTTQNLQKLLSRKLPTPKSSHRDALYETVIFEKEQPKIIQSEILEKPEMPEIKISNKQQEPEKSENSKKRTSNRLSTDIKRVPSVRDDLMSLNMKSTDRHLQKQIYLSTHQIQTVKNAQQITHLQTIAELNESKSMILNENQSNEPQFVKFNSEPIESAVFTQSLNFNSEPEQTNDFVNVQTQNNQEILKEETEIQNEQIEIIKDNSNEEIQVLNQDLILKEPQMIKQIESSQESRSFALNHSTTRLQTLTVDSQMQTEKIIEPQVEIKNKKRNLVLDKIYSHSYTTKTKLSLHKIQSQCFTIEPELQLETKEESDNILYKPEGKMKIFQRKDESNVIFKHKIICVSPLQNSGQRIQKVQSYQKKIKEQANQSMFYQERMIKRSQIAE
ncbi:Hypothetical_protein [Hexamita inflata]|uniref:Hypothetical_protein n=1 Tax=Hexamita inflata TaxID=28002 RepID=A0AA86P5D4_9EUKA|nr:Hypothetical protein HINF_LOCUS19573 [Hexamita inflata]